MCWLLLIAAALFAPAPYGFLTGNTDDAVVAAPMNSTVFRRVLADEPEPRGRPRVGSIKDKFFEIDLNGRPSSRAACANLSCDSYDALLSRPLFNFDDFVHLEPDSAHLCTATAHESPHNITRLLSSIEPLHHDGRDGHDADNPIRSPSSTTASPSSSLTAVEHASRLCRRIDFWGWLGWLEVLDELAIYAGFITTPDRRISRREDRARRRAYWRVEADPSKSIWKRDAEKWPQWSVAHERLVCSLYGLLVICVRALRRFNAIGSLLYRLLLCPFQKLYRFNLISCRRYSLYLSMCSRLAAMVLLPGTRSKRMEDYLSGPVADRVPRRVVLSRHGTRVTPFGYLRWFAALHVHVGSVGVLLCAWSGIAASAPFSTVAATYATVTAASWMPYVACAAALTVLFARVVGALALAFMRVTGALTLVLGQALARVALNHALSPATALARVLTRIVAIVAWCGASGLYYSIVYVRKFGVPVYVSLAQRAARTRGPTLAERRDAAERRDDALSIVADVLSGQQATRRRRFVTRLSTTLWTRRHLPLQPLRLHLLPRPMCLIQHRVRLL